MKRQASASRAARELKSLLERPASFIRGLFRLQAATWLVIAAKYLKPAIKHYV